MKKTGPRSLRAKMTLLSGGIIVVIAVGLTFASIFSAGRLFVTLPGTVISHTEPVIIQGSVEPAEAAEARGEALPGVQIGSFLVEEPPEGPAREALPTEQQKPQAADAAGGSGDEPPGAEAEVAAAERYSVSLTAKSRFAGLNIFLMVALALFGILAAYFLTGRALRPIQTLSDRIREMDEEDLSSRIPDPGSCAEIGYLTEAFNKMLGRLDAAFRSQKQFASAAAHELKTPLANMQTNLEVLEIDKPDYDPELEHTLAVLKRNLTRMNELVDDLLAMNANAALDMEETCALAVLVGEAEAELAPEIRRLGLEVSAACSGTVRGNRNLLGRMIGNLLENAVKYNHQGGSIRITSEEDGEGVLLTVRNSGQEIPPDALERIFEPFYRVDQSRSREVGGSGLGLAIVKSIVQLHGGRIAAESGGRETVFSIRLPKVHARTEGLDGTR